MGDCSGSGLGIVLMELEYGSSVSEYVRAAVGGHDARLGGESVEDCALLGGGASTAGPRREGVLLTLPCGYLIRRRSAI